MVLLTNGGPASLVSHGHLGAWLVFSDDIIGQKALQHPKTSGIINLLKVTVKKLIHILCICKNFDG